MNKKIFGIVICTLLIVSVFSSIVNANTIRNTLERYEDDTSSDESMEYKLTSDMLVNNIDFDDRKDNRICFLSLEDKVLQPIKIKL